jgi:hypothetical protein
MAGRKPARDAEHTVDLGPTLRADLFLERGDVSAVPPTADRQLYAPRTMRRCQLGIILFTGVGGVDGWEVLPALVC